jgi:uncharacterized protein (TIGR03089 family)
VTGPKTIGAMLAATIAIDPTRPQLTYYDDATDDRTECSGATLANWVAKTANMIVDDCGLGVGQRACVGLPPHWQTAAVLLGCWTVGLAVETTPQPADVAFVYVDDATHDWPAVERYALNLHPLALPIRDVPDSYVDFNSEVRVHGDHFYPTAIPSDTEALVRPDRSWTHAELLDEAAARASHLGLAGGRVLIDADAYPDVLDWLLTPLAGGASIVLCRNLSPEREGARFAAERATHRLL